MLLPCGSRPARRPASQAGPGGHRCGRFKKERRVTRNLPTKIIPTKIPRLELSGKFPTDLRIPPLNIEILVAIAAG